MRGWHFALIVVCVLWGSLEVAAAEPDSARVSPVVEEASAASPSPAASGQEGDATLFLNDFPDLEFDDVPLGTGLESSGNVLLNDFPPEEVPEEDIAWKRKARVHGMRLRTVYGPQAEYRGNYINSDEQSGTRQALGINVPISELWEGAMLDHLSFFSMKDGSGSAGRDALTLRLAKKPNILVRPWFAITPYFNFGDAKGEGVEVAAGAWKTWRHGATLRGELFAGRPWDEGYYTIVEDGRKYGGIFSFVLPFTDRFVVNSRAFYEEMDLGPGAKSGTQYAGNRYGVFARAYYRLLRGVGDHMNDGFRNEDLWDEEWIQCEFGPFFQIDYQRYFKPDGFDAFNPVPEVFIQGAGLSLQYAFSKHIGLVAEGFIGRDPDRDLEIGEIAGANARLVVVINPQLRVWGGASILNTNTSMESSGGTESIFSVGINYAF